MTQSPQPYDPPAGPESTPMVAEPQVDETIYRDGSRIVAHLAGFDGRTARFPRLCIRCATAESLEARTSKLIAQTRALDQLIPFVHVRFCICRKHAWIVRVWRCAGFAMITCGIVMFIMICSGSVPERPKWVLSAWLVTLSALGTTGAYLAGPYRGPLRSWKVREQRAWITGTGRKFRSQFAELPAELRRPVVDLISNRSMFRRKSDHY
jgi:hypothetical protein